MLLVFSLNTIYNVWKNKMKDYRMITLIIFISFFAIQLVDWMVLHEGATTTLDHLVQKSLKYKHYKWNYIRNLDEGIIPTGLRINKKPVVNTFLSDFNKNRKRIISKPERDLVQLSLQKEWSFPFQISLVNVTKSTVSCGFGQIYWRNL